MIMAGASLVGMGTAIHFRGIDVFQKVCDEMGDWCDENGVKSLGEIMGVAVV